MNEEDKQVLAVTLHTNQQATIQKFIHLLIHPEFETLAEFMHHYEGLVEHRQCQENWGTRTIVVHCLDCSKDDASCMCLPCFLNGDHTGHRVLFHKSTNGSCDCGDTCYMHEKGFCAKHRPKENAALVFPKCREVFEDIVSLIFSGVASDPEPEQIMPVVEWLMNFLSLGETFRYMMASGIAKSGCLSKIMKKFLIECPDVDYSPIVNMFGRLISNNDFRLEFTYATCEVVEDLTRHWISMNWMEQLNGVQNELYRFLFHADWPAGAEGCLTKGIDYVGMLINVIAIAMEYVVNRFNDRKNEGGSIYPSFMVEIWSITNLMETKKGRKQLQRFVDLLPDMLSLYRNSFEFDWDEEDSYDEYAFHGLLRTIMQHAIDTRDKMDIDLSHMCEVLFNENKIRARDHRLEVPVYEDKLHLIDPLQISFNLWLSKTGQNNRKSIEELCKRNGIDLDTYAYGMALFSARFILARELYLFSDLSTKNHMYREFTRIWSSDILPEFIYGIVGSLQISMGLCSDKEKFARMLATMLGLFGDYENMKIKRLIFFYMILSYVTDRDLDQVFSAKALSQELVSLLVREKPTLIDLSGLNEANRVPEHEWTDEILRVSSVSGSGKKKFTLKKSELWNPLTPVLPTNRAVNTITEWTQKNQGKRIPFRPWTEEKNGLELKGFLGTQVMMATAFDIMSDFVAHDANSCDISAHLVVGWIEYANTVLENKEGQPGDLITAETFTALIDAIPKGMPLYAFMNQKIAFKDREPTSMVEMMTKFGSVGKECLIKLSLIVETETSTSDATKGKSQAAAARRMMIMSQMRKQADKFAVRECLETKSKEKEETDEEVCSSCLQSCEERAGYPVMVYKTWIPLKFDGEESWPHILGFSACQHLHHIDCCTANDYTCSIDRRNNTNVLPRIKSFDELTDADRLGIETFVALLDTYERPAPVILVESLAGLMTVFEIRLRGLPDCLDNKRNKIIAQNLFMTIWHYMRICPTRILIENRTPFRAFIEKLVKSDSPVEQCRAFIAEGISELKEKPIDLWVFLRRALLTQYFCLGQEVGIPGSLTDWDHELLPEELSERFGVSIDCNESDIQPFTFGELPTDFVDFGKAPYEFPIWNCSMGCISLTERKYYPDIREFPVESFVRDTDLLIGTGNSSQLVMVFNPTEGRVFLMPPIYFDKFGIQNFGYERELPVKLNPDAYMRVIDQYLSGYYFDESYKG